MATFVFCTFAAIMIGSTYGLTLKDKDSRADLRGHVDLCLRTMRNFHCKDNQLWKSKICPKFNNFGCSEQQIFGFMLSYVNDNNWFDFATMTLRYYGDRLDDFSAHSTLRTCVHGSYFVAREKSTKASVDMYATFQMKMDHQVGLCKYKPTDMVLLKQTHELLITMYETSYKPTY